MCLEEALEAAEDSNFVNWFKDALKKLLSISGIILLCGMRTKTSQRSVLLHAEFAENYVSSDGLCQSFENTDV